MKKIFLVLILFSLVLDSYSQEAMKISNLSISLEEFRNTLMKNNNNEEITKKDLDEYIDLFVNYKLKVIEAKDLKLHEEESFISELEGYRKQLAKPYLQAKEFKENLIQEAYDRMRYDVNASHILLPIPDDLDTLTTYNKALLIKKKIEKGEITFDQAVNKYSDPVAKNNNGNLGYFTAFDMVYSFETVAYNTKVGNISLPVRTQFGYHLIKVNDKRPSVGEVKVSHIMFRIPKLSTDQQINEIKKKIDEVYNKLVNGEKFFDLANRYSEDRSTAVKGGTLPWFGLNKMAEEFEEASFSLENVGDFTNPFLTEFGWHIVILNDKKEIGNFEEERVKIKRLIEKGSRSKISDLRFINDLKKEYDFREHQYISYRKSKVQESINLEKLIEATLTPEDIKRSSKDTRHLFSINNNWYTQADFKDFILENQQIGVDFNAMYQRFIDFKFLELEENKLEEKYPEYKLLLNEFRDGILLFELTSKKVWNKAIEDTIGLRDFYNNNLENYWWNARVEANIYTCSKSSIFTLRRMLWKKSKNVVTIEDIKKNLNKEFPLNLKVTSGKFQKGENKYIDYIDWKKANYTLDNSDFSDILKDDIMFIEITRVLDPVKKELNETKGKVISDFQNFLEKEWISELKRKYPVVINKDVLYSIIK